VVLLALSRSFLPTPLNARLQDKVKTSTGAPGKSPADMVVEDEDDEDADVEELKPTKPAAAAAAAAAAPAAPPKGEIHSMLSALVHQF
jgi:hypothetical protein